MQITTIGLMTIHYSTATKNEVWKRLASPATSGHITKPNNLSFQDLKPGITASLAFLNTTTTPGCTLKWCTLKFYYSYYRLQLTVMAISNWKVFLATSKSQPFPTNQPTNPPYHRQLNGTLAPGGQSWNQRQRGWNETTSGRCRKDGENEAFKRCALEGWYVIYVCVLNLVECWMLNRPNNPSKLTEIHHFLGFK